jgi:hypothetical protein
MGGIFRLRPLVHTAYSITLHHPTDLGFRTVSFKITKASCAVCRHTSILAVFNSTLKCSCWHLCISRQLLHVQKLTGELPANIAKYEACELCELIARAIKQRLWDAARNTCMKETRKGEDRKRETKSSRNPRGAHRNLTQQHRPTQNAAKTRKPRWSINRPKQKKATTTHSRNENKPVPQGHPHRHKTQIHASGTRPRNKQEKTKGITRGHATVAPGKPGAGARRALASRGHMAHQ